MGVALEWQMTSGDKGWCHLHPAQGSVGPGIWRHPSYAWAPTAFGCQGKPPMPESAQVTFCCDYTRRVFFFSSLKLSLLESAVLENNMFPSSLQAFFSAFEGCYYIPFSFLSSRLNNLCSLKLYSQVMFSR